MKDFDTWNTSKIDVHEREQNRWCRPRDIWWCKLGVNVGFEQDGKGERFIRPVVVLRNFSIHTALIVPLTTNTKKNKYQVPLGDIMGKQSSAIVTQIRLIDTKRLFKKEGRVGVEHFEHIKKAIMGLLP